MVTTIPRKAESLRSCLLEKQSALLAMLPEVCSERKDWAA
jgi:hypothetical protein